jgi:hypothetical protein
MKYIDTNKMTKKKTKQNKTHKNKVKLTLLEPLNFLFQVISKNKSYYFLLI